MANSDRPDRFDIDINPPSPELARALDYLADSNAALHAQTVRLAASNTRLAEFLGEQDKRRWSGERITSAPKVVKLDVSSAYGKIEKNLPIVKCEHGTGCIVCRGKR